MSPTFRSLRNPNYRRYAAGSLVSNVGTWMHRIAQDWLVLQLSHGSGTALGITTGLQFLPVLLLSPYAGVLADRMPKRRLLQLTQASMAGGALLLGLLAISGHAELWHVYVLALVLGLGAAFDAPARQSFVPELVGREDIQNAVGLNSATFNLSRILGPALAGLLIGALGGGAVASGWVILINAASYAAIILQLEFLDTSLLHPSKPTGRAPGQLREGIAYVRSQPRIVFVLIVAFFAGTFGMNFQLTSALMATHVYGKGAGEYGILGSAVAVGSLIGALLAARRTAIPLKLIALAAVGFGASEVIAAVLPTYTLFAVFSPAIGLCTITLLNSANATVQLTSDPVFRGRAMALYMTIVMGGTPIGSPIIGWIGEQYGARWSLAAGGLLVWAGLVLATWVYFRTSRRAAAEAEPVEAVAAA